MDALLQPATFNPAVHLISLGNSTGHLAQALRGFDPEHVIGAHETDPADYLNQPVVNILARSGLSAIPASVPRPSPPDTEIPAGEGTPIVPTQMIKPETDAVATLVTGEFGNTDPAQMFRGIAHAFEPLQQSPSTRRCLAGHCRQTGRGAADGGHQRPSGKGRGHRCQQNLSLGHRRDQRGGHSHR